LSTSTQLRADPVKTVWRAVCRHRPFSISNGKVTAVLLVMLTLSGCKSRQLTRPTVQMDIETRFWVRVLLLDNVSSCTLKIGSPFSVTSDRADPQTRTTKARFGRSETPINIELTGGGITIAGRTFTNDTVIILADDPYIFNLDGKDYRGKLKLTINPDSGSFDAINLVPPEPYLAGVVGAEMPDYWEPEALKAQAIAARTYCFYIKRRFGGNRTWDLKQTAAHQVYRGLSAESAQVWNAVNQTKGQVLSCRQAGGTEDIFPTYYSSTCGGHTENSENVFGDSFETLIGVPCPYCKDVAKPRFFFWPMVQFDRADVIARLLQKYPKLKQLGGIANISPAGQSDYGEFSRLTKVELLGPNGKSDFLRAEDFRLTVDPTGRKFKSTICQIVKWQDKWALFSGRGWGHGVGMCQCGAQGMARQGKTAMQILSHYYPGSKIIGIY
jgi:stage II sporulation protein D